MRKRKYLSFLLAAVMLVTSIGLQPLTAFAEEDPPDLVLEDPLRNQSWGSDWRFYKTTDFSEDYSAEDADDTGWETVDLPHDWLIEQVKDLYQTSCGWYRKTFYIPQDKQGKRIKIRFDGIYQDSTIYVNGQEAGGWGYGYTTFEVDITDYIRYGNEPNNITVRVDHRSRNTRWYTGAGIYRNVWISFLDDTHVDFNGTYLSNDGKGGNLDIKTEILNESDEAREVTLRQTVYDADGRTVAEQLSDPIRVPARERKTVAQALKVENPQLWGIDDPYLYRVKTEILRQGQAIDTYKSTTGFRSIRTDPNEGFFLNDEYMKLNGVCLHHDQGALGTAINLAAQRRELRIMKEMGVNAIRTSHNMPAPEFLQLCDEMGIMVMVESFDTWYEGKNTYDYHIFYDEWIERDVRSWIRRDRNHPSAIMWSVANEIPEMPNDGGPGGRAETELQRINGWIREEDPNGNALLTFATNALGNANTQNLGQYEQAVGMNYGIGSATGIHNKHPDWVMYSSESASAVRSRGIYHPPADVSIASNADDQQVSSYDNAKVPWGDYAEDAWRFNRDNKWFLGEFVWTGFDYIGEPAPYSSKNAYFGIVDMTGIPKDIYYFYQSVWTQKPMVHLLPHWDWNEGETVSVWAYSNATSVELFLNGSSLGRQAIDLKTAEVMHYAWEVPYQQGELVAVGYDENGNEIARDAVSSFSDPASLVLNPDRSTIQADGKDISFVEVSTLDAQGKHVANATNRVEIKVEGAGELVAYDNGSSPDNDSFQSAARRLFSGKAMAYIRSDGTGGPITVTASSPGLSPTTVTLNAVHENPVQSITLDGIDGIQTITEPGGSLKMVPVLSPAVPDFDKVSYTVAEPDGSATDKASIDEYGVLRANKDGTVRVTATAKDGSGASAFQDIEISGQDGFTPVSEINISGADAIDQMNGKAAFTASVQPPQAGQDIVWSVYDESGSAVSPASIKQDGTLMGLHDGVAVVRATAADGSGVYAEKTVAISNQLDAGSYARKIGLQVMAGSQALTDDSPEAVIRYQVFPADADADVRFRIIDKDGYSSNKSAMVTDNGDGTATVTGITPGEFRLYATCGNGTGQQAVLSYLPFTCAVNTDYEYPEDPDIVCEAELSKNYHIDNYLIEGGGTAVGGIRGGDWVAFDVDFGIVGTKSVTVVGSNGTGSDMKAEIRDGAPDGPLLATVTLKPTGGWGDYQPFTEKMTALGDGHEIYVVFPGGGVSFDKVIFTLDIPTPVYGQRINASSYSTGSKEFAQETGGIGGIFPGDWMIFKDLNFGSGPRKMTLSACTISDSARFEIREGDKDGPLLTTVTLKNSGSWTEPAQQTFELTGITGKKDLCFVFITSAIVLDWFEFIPQNQPYQSIGGGMYDDCRGSFTETELGLSGIQSGDYLVYKNLDFGGSGTRQLQLCAASETAQRVQVREGGADGEILATVQLKATGPDTVKEQLFDLRGLTGVRDICLCFSAPAVLQSLQFFENSPYAQINAETFDIGSKEHFSPGDVGLGGIAPGDWMTFENLDFGRDGSDTLVISAASPNQPEVQIRENDPNGKLLTSVRLNSSGGWDKAAVTTLDLSGLRGIKDLCFVFPSGSIIFDSFHFTKARASANVDAFFPIEAEDYNDALTSGTSFGFGSYIDENGREQKVVTGLGNNMSLYYKKINFGLTGSSRVAVKGMTPLELCRISLLVGENRTDLEFAGGDGYRTQVLDLSESYTGIQTVTFMFLPGSEFDFDCFTFSKDAVILPVETAIDDIGDIGQLTEADRPKVEAARKAYDRLDREQQVFVLNQPKLLDAEKKLQLLDYKLSLRDGAFVYLENGVLSGLDAGTSADAVLSQFAETQGAEIFVLNGNAEVCDPADLAGTGFTVCMKVDSIITDQVQIAVYGDVNGDASAGVSDLLAIKSFILGRLNPDEAQRAAADVNRDGVINIFDLVQIKMQILRG